MTRLGCKVDLVEVVDDSMHGVENWAIRIIFAASFTYRDIICGKW